MTRAKAVLLMITTTFFHPYCIAFDLFLSMRCFLIFWVTSKYPWLPPLAWVPGSESFYYYSISNFPFHITAMDSFSFFFFLFSLFTFFFIHSSLLFNSCIGRVQLIYTFTFSIFAIQFGLFFFSLALLHIIILVVVAFCLFFSSDFCEFLFLSGHYIDHKNKELASASNLVFFEFILFLFHSHYNPFICPLCLSVFMRAFFFLFSFAPTLSTSYLPPSIIMGRKKKNFFVRVYIYYLVTGMFNSVTIIIFTVSYIISGDCPLLYLFCC
ncbi:hypothetical protein B9Z19DRAFT_2576 [Tuber borchii]|uniref:Uncharacterized protein n=1 Tax=Tuber borchii TaxID=42251 RepID=A0A2T7A9D8_TUBBO|nr:hypothetical protein B9Z19DRAFT_2576 [Tuber borchii]